MNIGRVVRDVYIDINKNKTPLLVMDIRTITVRKKFKISINKNKYKDGVIDKYKISLGKEDSPDYLIWYNVNGKGESLPSENVGCIDDAVTKEGVAYKKGYVFDPFIQKEPIHFAMFSVDENKRSDENHIYNIVVTPKI